MRGGIWVQVTWQWVHDWVKELLQLFYWLGTQVIKTNKIGLRPHSPGTQLQPRNVLVPI